MKPRNKFFIGALAAILTFGTLSATVGRHYAHHHPHGCGHGYEHQGCGEQHNEEQPTQVN